MPARTGVCLAALALVLGSAGCGGGSDADESAVKRTVNGLYDAFAAKDGEKVCDSLTAERRQEIERQAGGGRGCARTVNLVLSFAGSGLEQLKRAEVTDVAIDGDMATATVESKGRSGNLDLGLTKEGGEWKVSDLDLSSVR